MGQSPSKQPLLLTTLIESGKLSLARSLSSVKINGLPLGHSGFFTVSSLGGKANNIFFFYQPCTDCEDPSVAPLIQWFNGGPGSPDTVGLFNQIGRYYVSEDLSLQERCHTLCRTSSCLFLDSPVGTGYSFQAPADNGSEGSLEPTPTSSDVARQAVSVLKQFLTIFPEHLGADLFVAGLSYAGHYVPHYATRLLAEGSSVDVNLVGVLVGDPAMYHEREIGEYPAVFKALGLVDKREEEELRGLMRRSGERSRAGDCVGAFEEWNKVFNDDGGSSCGSDCQFLFKKWTGSENTEHVALLGQPAEFDYFRKFLKVGGVEEALHVAGSPASGASNATMSEGGLVYTAMVESGDFCENTTPLFAELLEAGVDVFITAGNMDVLLGPAPVGEAVKGILEEWGKGTLGEFEGKRKSMWVVNGDTKGYSKCIERGGVFCFVVVRNAGHEVASYQPEANWDVMRRLMKREWEVWEGGGETPKCFEVEGGAGPLLDL
ncbi:hypothetical protein TrCOL_g3132 [Triparma columacea]|uniref:Carboxypeptidase n=1 Tax=Triparma columacea TaxID=722753 RepID=A0A9W7L1C2_9STRA|nr:hypothetical protein TrCOL_g3132 [Triparma columacea]